MGKFRQDLTVVFETLDDMQDWLAFLEFQSKRLKCRPEEVISKLVEEWKKGIVVEVVQVQKTQVAVIPNVNSNKRRRRKSDDDDPDAPKILADGPQ